MLGSIRAITDSSGEVAARFEYEPFGLVIEESGIAASGAERYTGKPYDQGIGFYFFGARYYDPEVGRFTSRDLAKDGLNWYAYCRQNPLVYVDPDGWKIRFAHGSKDSDIDAYYVACSYLRDSKTGDNLINMLENSRQIFTIKFLEYPSDPPANQWDMERTAYVIETRTIEWCPDMGLRLKDGKIQTPALALAHEMGHAAQSLDDYPRWDKWLCEKFPIISEQRNLNDWESKIAKELGEPSRKRYPSADVWNPLPRTMGPTSCKEHVPQWSAPSGTCGLLY